MHGNSNIKFISTLHFYGHPKHPSFFWAHCCARYTYCTSKQLFLGTFAKLRKATISFFMSACRSVRLSVRFSSWRNSVPLDGFSWNLILVMFPNSVDNFQVSLKSDKNNGTLHEAQYIFLIISLSNLLKTRNVSDKCVEKIEAYILCGKML